jgi:DNA-binding CsgD family transcriptional regulator
VVTIPVRAPDRSFPWLIHCAVDWTEPRRVEKYVQTVLSRSSPHPAGREPQLRTLTPREREILQLLCQDETLYGIACRTGLSYATVRNHVQHIEAKLGVHSVLEAIACCLLERNRDPLT